MGPPGGTFTSFQDLLEGSRKFHQVAGSSYRFQEVLGSSWGLLRVLTAAATALLDAEEEPQLNYRCC